MTQVSVSELKARLSHYLREVRRGGEIQVVARGVPIARLTQLPATEGAGRDRRRREGLIKAGILRPGRGDASPILARPALESEAEIRAALSEERSDRL